MTTPVVVVFVSTSRSAAGAPPSGKRRRPDPSNSGWIRRTYSSTRSWRIRDRTSSPLPRTTRSPPGCSLSVATAANGIALEHRGVLPRERLLQRPRRHVLLTFVQHGGERVVIRLSGPEGRELLVGAAPEQQSSALGDPLRRDIGHDLIEVGRRPSTVFEPAAAILVVTARRLHHAVEREVRVHDELAHRGVLIRRTVVAQEVVDLGELVLAESRHASTASAFSRTWSGLVAPAITVAISGWLASQDIASSRIV